MLMLKQLTLHNGSKPLAYKLEDGHLTLWTEGALVDAPNDSTLVEPEPWESWHLRVYLASTTEIA